MKCPACNKLNAYVGFSDIECKNHSCVHFKDKNEVDRLVISDGENEYSAKIQDFSYWNGELGEEQEIINGEDDHILVSLGPITENVSIEFKTNDVNFIKLVLDRSLNRNSCFALKNKEKLSIVKKNGRTVSLDNCLINNLYLYPISQDEMIAEIDFYCDRNKGSLKDYFHNCSIRSKEYKSELFKIHGFYSIETKIGINNSISQNYEFCGETGSLNCTPIFGRQIVDVSVRSKNEIVHTDKRIDIKWKNLKLSMNCIHETVHLHLNNDEEIFHSMFFNTGDFKVELT